MSNIADRRLVRIVRTDVSSIYSAHQNDVDVFHMKSLQSQKTACRRELLLFAFPCGSLDFAKADGVFKGGI
jgi:hypothetical protein